MKYRIAKKYLNNLNPIYETQFRNGEPIEFDFSVKPSIGEKIDIGDIKIIQEIIHSTDWITLVIF